MVNRAVLPPRSVSILLQDGNLNISNRLMWGVGCFFSPFLLLNVIVLGIAWILGED